MTHDPLPPLTPEEGGLHGDIPDTPEARAWFQELGEKAQTATHDPMCPFRPAPPEEYAPIEVTVACQCDLIAKVRADERLVYAGGATVNTIKAVDGVTQDEITEFLEKL